MHSVLAGWSVVTGGISPQAPTCVETLRWSDEFGPLQISSVSTTGSEFYRLRQGDDIIVDLHADRTLFIRSSAAVPQITINHFLGDQVYPRILAGEGKLVLHAAAVRLDRRAILLIGPSGRGKSTLATSFIADGDELLGDDATIVSDLDGIASAKAVYPSLRLLPDSIEELLPTTTERTPIAHYSAKQRVGLPLATASEPVPIGAIFLLRDGHDDVTVSQVSQREACMALVENSFALDPSDIAMARNRMTGATRLADRSPAFALAYPRDYARLPEVRAAIRSALSNARMEPQ